MNRIYINITLLLSIIIGLNSCELEERTLELENHESKLVIDAQIIQSDIDQKILITESLGITDTLFPEQFTELLPGSSISLVTPDLGTIEGYIYKPANEFAQISLPIWKFDYSDFIEGEEYTIEGFADDHTPVSATVSIPNAPILEDITFTKEEGQSSNYFLRDKWEISIDDPSDQENYYLISAEHIYFIDTFENRNNVRFYDIPNNPIDIGFIENRVSVVSDKNFNGSIYKLTIYGERPPIEDSTIEFKIYQISKTHYDYLIQYDLYNNNNPFSEPVTFTSNITDGYGVFCITSKPLIRTIEL